MDSKQFDLEAILDSPKMISGRTLKGLPVIQQSIEQFQKNQEIESVSGLGDNGDVQRKKYQAAAGKKRVPTIDLYINDRDFRKHVINDGAAYTFTDKNNNCHVAGYAPGDTNNGKPTHYDYLISSGLIYLNFSKNVIEAQTQEILRGTGNGWDDTLANALTFSPKMTARQSAGYNPVPYLYKIRSPKILTWTDFVSVFFDIVAAAIAIIPGGMALTPYVAGIGNILKTWAAGQPLTFASALQLAQNFAPLLVGNIEATANKVLENTFDVNIPTMQKYVTIGMQLKDGIQRKDLNLVGAAMGLKTSNMAGQAADLLGIGDTQGLSQRFGLSLFQSEKIMLSKDFAELQNALYFNPNKILDKAKGIADSMEIPEVQTFLTAAISSNKEMLFALPNKKEILNSIAINTQFTTPDEIATMFDLGQEDIAKYKPEMIVPLAVDALTKKAQQLNDEKKKFILPSNIDASLKGIILNEIYARTGIKGQTSDGKIKGKANKFAMEFV